MGDGGVSDLPRHAPSDHSPMITSAGAGGAVSERGGGGAGVYAVIMGKWLC